MPLDAVHEVESRLRAAGVPSPRVDAEILVADVLGLARSELYSSGRPVTAFETERLDELVGRRLRREPLAYILGEWGFRRLLLKVDDRALIPRPETEVVVERCLAFLGGLTEPRVLDVGVGSGAIALAIADEHDGAQIVAVDSSEQALSLARENQARAGVNGRVRLVRGDLLSDVEGPFDLVVSNPPYVSPEEYESASARDPALRALRSRRRRRHRREGRRRGTSASRARRPPRPRVRGRAGGRARGGSPVARLRPGRRDIGSRRARPRGRGKLERLVIAAQSIDAAISALRAGQTVILPTDTVYGLCVDAYHEAPIRRLLRQKKRPKEIPVALVASDLEVILDAVPELRGRAAVMARAVLPGPYTLVLPNPACRYRWLTGTRPETIGVRIPDLPAEAKAALDGFGAVAMTSANVHGGPDPARVEDIPEEILRAAAAVVDAGALPGTPSTVIDLTGPEPEVLREGAVPAPEALAKIARATTG